MEDTSSVKMATDHVKKNKHWYAIIIAIIVLAIIIFVAWNYFNCSTSSGSDSMSNLTTGSNNPNWQLGSQMSQAAVASPMMEKRFGGGSCCCSGGSSEGMCGSGGCGSYAYPSGAGSCYGVENGPFGMSHGAMAELDAQVQAGNFAPSSPGWSKMQNAIDSVNTASSALSDGTLSAMLYSSPCM